MENNEKLILIKLLHNLYLLTDENRLKIYYISEAIKNKNFNINDSKELFKLIENFMENNESE